MLKFPDASAMIVVPGTITMPRHMASHPLGCRMSTIPVRGVPSPVPHDVPELHRARRRRLQRQRAGRWIALRGIGGECGHRRERRTVALELRDAVDARDDVVERIDGAPTGRAAGDGEDRARRGEADVGAGEVVVGADGLVRPGARLSNGRLRFRLGGADPLRRLRVGQLPPPVLFTPVQHFASVFDFVTRNFVAAFPTVT